MKTILIFLIILLCGNNLKSQPIDSLTNFSQYSSLDTLKIAIYISDCGEFGGHGEIINVFKADKVMITYQRDPRVCITDLSFMPKDRKV
jgi:hypothetical protein